MGTRCSRCLEWSTEGNFSRVLWASTIYIIGGETDIAYENVEADFADISAAPVFVANLAEVGHVGTI